MGGIEFLEQPWPEALLTGKHEGVALFVCGVRSESNHDATWNAAKRLVELLSEAGPVDGLLVDVVNGQVRYVQVVPR